jgi:DNA-directed RNA polymerase specialized sigma24 family protein
MAPTPDDYTRLYRRHAQPLLLYFQRRVHEPEMARDLLAETFESAIAGGPAFRGSTDNELSGWLWTIARNALAEQRRREQGERDRRMRVLEDMPYNEIAARMNTSPDTARARVSRGLRALNVALEDQHKAWREG